MRNRWRDIAYGHISDTVLEDIYTSMAIEDISKISYELRYISPPTHYKEAIICAIDRYSKDMLEMATKTGFRRYSVACTVAEEWMDALVRQIERLERKRK